MYPCEKDGEKNHLQESEQAGFCSNQTSVLTELDKYLSSAANKAFS